MMMRSVIAWAVACNGMTSPLRQPEVCSRTARAMASACACIFAPWNGGDSKARCRRCCSPEVRITDSGPTIGSIGFGVGAHSSSRGMVRIS